MKFQRKQENEILALRIALILAKQEAKKLKDTDDGGTCNLDLPVLLLPKWHKQDIEEAFKNTGLWASIEGDYVYICGAVDGCGFKRTAMARAVRDSLQQSGYQANVRYLID